ncbi:hypothetical protein FOZ63_010942 [Perkinsus olseni]|uniref:Uncharacterized protein n=1 Tax=Perkinsus olseni TaxID=32597 RepID=A0A7J6SJ65_PEROL|nr:hypothetical protein FOZ63_010942 [Perkinsus olseni]
MTGEVNSQGVKPRFIGFRLESNLPGSDKGEYGTFELQWALPEGGANSQAVNVSGTGQVQLSVGTDEVFMRLALGSPYITTTEDGVTAVNISCHVLAYFNEAAPWTANVATPWYYTGGRANTFAIALHSPVVESRAEAFNGNFYTTQLHISILQARGNSYQLAASFWADGAYVPWGERELRPFGIYTDIVTGYVYY